MAERTELLIVERDGPLAVLTLNRVERRNALSIGLLEAIRTIFTTEAESPQPARAIIIRSNGPVFSAGSDFQELNQDISTGAADHTSETSHLETTFKAIESYPYPVIARLHGGVYGAGCMLACACDIRVGVKGMRFSKNPAKLGIIYPPAGIGRLIRVVGSSFAKEMLLTGGVYDDETALRQGLITHLLDEEETDDLIKKMVENILGLGPASLRATKRMFAMLREDPVDHEALKKLHMAVSTGPEALEGVRAVVEKRKADFGE